LSSVAKHLLTALTVIVVPVGAAGTSGRHPDGIDDTDVPAPGAQPTMPGA